MNDAQRPKGFGFRKARWEGALALERSRTGLAMVRSSHLPDAAPKAAGALWTSQQCPAMPYCLSKIATFWPLSVDTVCVIVFPSAEIVAVITSTTFPFSFMVILLTPASVISQIWVP